MPKLVILQSAEIIIITTDQSNRNNDKGAFECLVAQVGLGSFAARYNSNAAELETRGVARVQQINSYTVSLGLTARAARSCAYGVPRDSQI